MQIVAIAAVAQNGVIGFGGRIPWHIPEDFARFKRVTMGHQMIMGRATFDSIGRPLPGRDTIVLTRDRSWQPPREIPEDTSVSARHTTTDALELAAELAARRGTEEPICWIAGGAQVYRAFWDVLTGLDITWVLQDPPGDVYFPEITKEFVTCAVQPHDDYIFQQYLRV